MNDAIHGQIVPALDAWEGTIAIVAVLAASYLSRRLRIVFGKFGVLC